MSCMLSVHTSIKISYLYHLRCECRRNCQSQMSVTCWLFVDIHGSVTFPILPIDTENPFRLSKRTLSIMFSPFNLQISHPVWQLSFPQVCRDEWVMVCKAMIRCLESRSSISEQLWDITSNKLLCCFYPNKMDTNSHCYASVFCYNLIIWPVPVVWTSFSRNLVFRNPIPRGKVVYHACVHPGCSEDCKHREAPLWFTENICLPRWINQLQYRLSIEMFIDNLQQN